jgi:Pectate lyase superfamily protein
VLRGEVRELPARKTTAAPSFISDLVHVQAPPSSWLSVRDFGAKCDGASDDSPAIAKAVAAAEQRALGGGNTVYFPPSVNGCVIGSALNLTDSNVRITLFFDTRIILNATVNLGDDYTLHGNTPSAKVAFATEGLTMMNVGYSLIGPAIHIQGTGTRLENLSIDYLHGDSDGIVIDESAQITLKNVWVAMDGNNTAGIPLKITGGFGIYIDGGGYAAAWNSTGHSIEINDSARCNWTGIIRMRDTFFSGHGVLLNEYCGGINSLSFDNILYENSRTPFVTIHSGGGSGVWGLDFKGVNFADSQGPFAVVDVHGGQVQKISIINCSTDFNAPMTTGDPIVGLHVW